MPNEWDDWLKGRRRSSFMLPDILKSPFKSTLFAQHELPGRVRVTNPEGKFIVKGLEELGWSKHKLTNLLRYIRENQLTTGKKFLVLPDGTQIFMKEVEGNTRIDIMVPEIKIKPMRKLEPRKAIQFGIVPCYQVINDDRISDGYIPVKQIYDGSGISFEHEEWKEGVSPIILPDRQFNKDLEPDRYEENINECKKVKDHSPGLTTTFQQRNEWAAVGIRSSNSAGYIGPNPDDYPNFIEVYHPDGTMLAGNSYYQGYTYFTYGSLGGGDVWFSLASKWEHRTNEDSGGTYTNIQYWQPFPGLGPIGSWNIEFNTSFPERGNLFGCSSGDQGLKPWNFDFNYHPNSDLPETWQFQNYIVSYVDYMNGISPLEIKQFLNIKGFKIELKSSIDYPALPVTNRIYSARGRRYHLYSYYYRETPLVSPGSHFNIYEINKYDKIRYGIIIPSSDSYRHYYRDFDVIMQKDYYFMHKIEIDNEVYMCNGDFYLINVNPEYFDQTKFGKG